MLSRLRQHWPIIVILLLAAVLRLYRIGDYMEFLGDQGRDVVIVKDFLQHGNLFFIGPQTSIGNMYLGPFYYYLIAPSLLLANFNPIGPAIFVALIGVATVYLLYHLSLKYFNHSTAILASFLYAISPTVIKYSNFSWNPNIMPFFGLLFVYLLLQRKYPLATLSFVMALNSHYLALLLLPLGILIFLSQENFRQSFKTILISVFILALSFTPQVLFDLKHQGQNIKAITTFFTQREQTVNLKAYKSLPRLPALHHQVTTSLLAAKNQTLGLFLAIITALAMIFILFQSSPPAKFLVLWYLIGLVGLGIYKQHIYDHYFGFIFPPLFIILSQFLLKSKYLLIPTILLISFFSIQNSPLRYPVYQLRSVDQITQFIDQQSNHQPFNFALLAKQNYDPPYRYFFSLHHSPIVDLPHQLAEQLFVVCEPFQIDCYPINHPEWAIAAFGWAKIDHQWQIDDKIIYRLVHSQP